MKAEEQTTTNLKWLGGNQKRPKGGLLEARRGNIGDVTPTAPFVPELPVRRDKPSTS